MFQPSEEHLVELLYRDSLGFISKEEIKFIIEKEKELGVFNLKKAYNSVFGWIDPKE